MKSMLAFALVKFVQSESRDYFSIAEFFILKKYRFGWDWKIHRNTNI